MNFFRSDKKATDPQPDYSGRRKLLLAVMLGGMAMLIGRSIDLQVINKQFLQKQGNIRQIKTVAIPAYRGKILDRNGEPLAISTLVHSIWVNSQFCKEYAETTPKQVPEECFEVGNKKLTQLAGILKTPLAKVEKAFAEESGRKFAYLKRRASPDLVKKVKSLQLPGVYFEPEFKRFYPSGEVSAHVLGYTDIKDVGQEGLELMYEQVLKGQPGLKRVIKDGRRQIIDDIESIKEPVSGQNLELTIDQNLQYLAYREIKTAVKKHQAQSGSLVILDAKNGDILAAVNYPSFNPNGKKNLKFIRNRAFIDKFEPGSTTKPFVVSAALDGGYIKPDIVIETHGFQRVGRHLVRDIHDYGDLDLTAVLKKSSNVAASKIALAMPSDYFWGFYNKLGFGELPGVGFPGETSGFLLDYQSWGDFEKATLSFGYSLSTSALQLARAYTALADDGVLHSVSLMKREQDYDAQRVISVQTARRVRAMLEHVVKKDGTAYSARVDGYHVAGKTGTVKKPGAGGYASDSYLSVFAGMVPASNPQLVAVVVVDEPSVGGYYGGIVAGPVFSKVMGGALRLLNIAPDAEVTMPLLLVRKD
jgi:cell division protein FtsI (penicillin-binding protein 3)